MDGNVGSAPGVIGALSVLGDRFDVQLAIENTGLAPADLLRALDDAQRKGTSLDPGLGSRPVKSFEPSRLLTAMPPGTSTTRSTPAIPSMV